MFTNLNLGSLPGGLILVVGIALFAARFNAVNSDTTTAPSTKTTGVGTSKSVPISSTSVAISSMSVPISSMSVPISSKSVAISSTPTPISTATNKSTTLDKDSSVLQCLVCSSNPALKSKDPGKANEALFHEDCRYPTDKLLTIDQNPRIIKCADFTTKMDAFIGTWRKDQGYKIPPAGGTDVGCTAGGGAYSVCASMYYESSSDYKHLENTDKYDKFTGDKELVLRFCACAEPELLKELEKSGKVCEDIKRGSVRRRTCYCNPSHPSFKGKTCNRSISLSPPPYCFWLIIFSILKYFNPTKLYP